MAEMPIAHELILELRDYYLCDIQIFCVPVIIPEYFSNSKLVSKILYPQAQLGIALRKEP